MLGGFTARPREWRVRGWPSEAKTDKRDAMSSPTPAGPDANKCTCSDELLDRLRVFNGFDIDLAANQTRLTTGAAMR